MLSTTNINAELFKWVDEHGTVHYTDKPPTEDAPTLEIKGNISSYSAPEVTPLSEDFFSNDKPAKQKKSAKVIMYSATWCGVCKKAKSYFQKKNIKFTEYDIDTSKKGKKDFEKLKGKGVPIILVGKQRMNGFSIKNFENLYYGKNKKT